MTTFLAIQITTCGLLYIGLGCLILMTLIIGLTLIYQDRISDWFRHMTTKLRKIHIPVPRFQLPPFAQGLTVSACILALFIWFAVAAEKKPCGKEAATVAAVIMPCGCK